MMIGHPGSGNGAEDVAEKMLGLFPVSDCDGYMIDARNHFFLCSGFPSGDITDAPLKLMLANITTFHATLKGMVTL
ncbi:MAG: hypothetical protein LLG97_20755 [Deltaproteobacteria bacterium]|nr:hypothetical protein [Deltaproteobacteria bacterium]